MCVWLILLPLPLCRGSLQPVVLWKCRKEGLAESDGCCNRILIRLFRDYINSGANLFNYLASDCQAMKCPQILPLYRSKSETLSCLSTVQATGSARKPGRLRVQIPGWCAVIVSWQLGDTQTMGREATPAGLPLGLTNVIHKNDTVTIMLKKKVSFLICTCRLYHSLNFHCYSFSSEKQTFKQCDLIIILAQYAFLHCAVAAVPSLETQHKNMVHVQREGGVKVKYA